tara:strand:- start:80 stop:376 length:297 start_codon:yes stop_codon:yes gene_type:complete
MTGLITYVTPKCYYYYCSDDPDVQQQAAAALRGLAVNDTNKLKLVQEGALQPLVQLLQMSDDVEIQREAVGAIANITIADENKFEVRVVVVFFLRLYD